MNALAEKPKLKKVIKKYLSAQEKIENAYRLLDEASDEMALALNVDDVYIVATHRGTGYAERQSKKKLYTRTWKELLDIMKVKQIVSVKKIDELGLKIDNQEMPDITLENISEFLESLRQNYNELLTDTVKEVYRWLRPRDAYKSNSQWEVSGRLILKNVIDRGAWNKVSGYYQDELRALDRVFHVLDGKEFNLNNQQLFPIAVALMNGETETEYFRFETFKNGNMHLRIKNKKLEKKFNRIAGGDKLRP